MLPDIQPGNTKILYFFNCLLDGMHTTKERQYPIFVTSEQRLDVSVLSEYSTCSD